MITLSVIKAMQPGSREWDQGTGAVSGFHARRQKGDAITYMLKYHVGGRARWHTIGRHGPPWTPDTARKEARRLLGLVAGGGDPAGVKAAVKAAPTLADLAARFLAEHAEAKRKASTTKEYRRLIENLILPALGKHKVAEVTRADVARFHHSRRGTPIEANRALALLSTLFNWAERVGERPDGSNPCRHVERFPQRPRERFLSADELARLGDALREGETIGMPHEVDESKHKANHAPQAENRRVNLDPLAVAAIRLLILTGARLREILHANWENVDFERGVIFLPDSKTGKKTLYLRRPWTCSPTSLASKAIRTSLLAPRTARRVRTSRSLGPP